MKAIALIRVSTQAQEFESQTFMVKEAILRDGYDESNIILIEDKESGSKLSEEERSGLNRLKRAIETEPVDAVYVYEVSRISRRTAVVFSIRDYLISRQIQLVVLNPPCRLLNADGTMSNESNIVFSLFSTMSENETYIRKKRIMRGKNRKRAEGKLSCGKPVFGYTIDKDHYVIPHPTNAKIVQEIYERYANLESSGSIGKDMWLRGALFTKSTKMLSHQTYVCAILKDKRYAKLDPKYEDIYPAIISKELFNKVQEIHSSKPDYFVRKSRTKEVYPLQGFLYTEDGYRLTPSISNNRYLKMDGASKEPISLNMKAVHLLSTIVLNQYVASGVLDEDREQQRKDLNDTFLKNKVKLSGIDGKITLLQEENDRINMRIIKNKMSPTKGDALIDKNIEDIHKLEDERQSLYYSNSVIENRLIYLANPLFQDVEINQATNNEELKYLVCRYLKKAVVRKIGHSRYMLTYFFSDGTQKLAGFYSHSKGIECFDENQQPMS